MLRAVLGQALMLAFLECAPLLGFVVRLRSLHAAAVLRARQLSSFAFRCRGRGCRAENAWVDRDHEFLARLCVLHHLLRAVNDNSDSNGFNAPVQPYATAVYSDSSRHVAEESFLRFAGIAMDATFCEGRFVYINAWREITTDPIENNHLAVCEATSLAALDDYFASDLFMSGCFLVEAVWSERPHCGEASLVLPPEDADGCSVALQTAGLGHRLPWAHDLSHRFR